jgi:uncharacterized protein with NRDE domain
MCLALLAIGAHPRYAVVIAANRDEFHARASAPAHWWDDGWLAGRDLTAGGTWLGITRTGRWALITNVREPARYDPAAPSRGALVPRLLADATPMSECIADVLAGATRHNGFNLLAGSGAEAHWASNRAAPPRTLASGVYGLSNAALDTPWPKVARTRASFSRWCASADIDLEPLFALLDDRTTAPDHELPATGIGIEKERLLSAPFIVSADYGTRCSTVLAIDCNGDTTFVERSFDSAGRTAGAVEERFRLAPATLTWNAPQPASQTA